MRLLAIPRTTVGRTKRRNGRDEIVEARMADVVVLSAVGALSGPRAASFSASRGSAVAMWASFARCGSSVAAESLSARCGSHMRFLSVWVPASIPSLHRSALPSSTDCTRSTQSERGACRPLERHTQPPESMVHIFWNYECAQCYDIVRFWPKWAFSCANFSILFDMGALSSNTQKPAEFATWGFQKINRQQFDSIFKRIRQYRKKCTAKRR